MKEIVEYHPNKLIKEKGKVDENGKQGKWQFYSEEGLIFMEVEYRNNIEHGLSTRYFSNGQVAIRSNYSDGKLDGYGTEYYENGNIMEEWIYQNGEFIPIDFWDVKGEQTLKKGTGFKMVEFDPNGGDVYKQYFENGIFTREEQIKSSTYLGFTPSE